MVLFFFYFRSLSPSNRPWTSTHKHSIDSVCLTRFRFDCWITWKFSKIKLANCLHQWRWGGDEMLFELYHYYRRRRRLPWGGRSFLERKCLKYRCHRWYFTISVSFLFWWTNQRTNVKNNKQACCRGHCVSWPPTHSLAAKRTHPASAALLFYPLFLWWHHIVA